MGKQNTRLIVWEAEQDEIDAEKEQTDLKKNPKEQFVKPRGTKHQLHFAGTRR